ncbi:hypothetical protein MMEU_0569 [Mycobacterium marinum str. Europe]|nr:hypothetical protein MMEU_0569 [Mycobacterium marinum str. Europe]
MRVDQTDVAKGRGQQSGRRYGAIAAGALAMYIAPPRLSGALTRFHHATGDPTGR